MCLQDVGGISAVSDIGLIHCVDHEMPCRKTPQRVASNVLRKRAIASFLDLFTDISEAARVLQFLSSSRVVQA